MSHRQHIYLRVVALAVIATLQFFPRDRSHDPPVQAPVPTQAEAVAISR